MTSSKMDILNVIMGIILLYNVWEYANHWSIAMAITVIVIRTEVMGSGMRKVTSEILMLLKTLQDHTKK